MPSLGYLYDHPLAVASVDSDKRWDIDLLMEGVFPEVAPDHYLDPGVREALDQDGVGACVAFSGCVLQEVAEARDEGADLFVSGTWTNSPASTGAFRNYYDLKHGYGSFPGDGIPDVEGSYPEAFWKLGLAEGFLDKNGKRHKLSAYYSHAFASDADFDYLQQVLLAYGPVNFGIPWPSNWMAPPPAPDFKMPAPSGPIGGHAITAVGWDIDPDGTRWVVFAQTWGTSWTNAQGLYRVKASWLYTAPLGPQLMWKVVDMADAPVPPVGGDMVPVKDKVERKVRIPAGTQLYDPTTGMTPVVKLGAASDVLSPFAASDSQYAVFISTGGVLQVLRVAKSACTVLTNVAVS